MTAIAFHFNAPAKISYACRLLRKAAASGGTVAVLAPEALLTKLDEQLWTFSALDFIPHIRVSGQAEQNEHEALTPIWLCSEAVQGVGRQVLVNLSPEIAVGFEQFERVIEVVTQDDTDRAAARLRWRHYTERGYEIVRHDLKIEA